MHDRKAAKGMQLKECLINPCRLKPRVPFRLSLALVLLDNETCKANLRFFQGHGVFGHLEIHFR